MSKSSSKTKTKQCRLMSFEILDEEMLESDNENSSDDEKKYKKKEDSKIFKIQVFGINEKRETFCLYLTDFKPFFYAKVPDNWKKSNQYNFINDIKKKIGDYYANSLCKHTMVQRKKLYGFDGGKKYKFIRLEFNNTRAMNKAMGLWYDYNKKSTDSYNYRKLKVDGYNFNGTYIKLYEKIPSLLRYFHIQEVSPSGWVEINLNNSIKLTNTNKRTTCKYEYEIKYSDLLSLPDKETIVPYKICSFDIEASSSHGDFPLAIKTYNKLAMNIVDNWMNIDTYQKQDVLINELKSMIYAAFEFNEYYGIDTVYCKKKKIKIQDIDRYFNALINIKNTNKKTKKRNKKEVRIDEIHEQKIDENEPKIINILNSSIKREFKVKDIDKLLSRVFPNVQGDKVTFIGSTFMNYGDKRSYKNHCIVLNTCSDIKDVDNVELESYQSEREVLVAWRKLIQREDPDIIIGYNIFGFDYKFMFERAKELNCLESFLKLSRNKNEICKNPRNRNEIALSESKIVIASGEHELHFIKMTGRMQIDMYNYFRREENLTSYKLDYVSGHFIGDKIKKLEYDDCSTKIYSKNLSGLEKGSFIHIEEISHTTEYYKGGAKFKVIDIDEENYSFILSSIEQPDNSKTLRWCLAKDDVTPQDIFRMTNEGPDERAVIAKYCIQDCNLVHYLTNKIDVITGFIEMSKLCSVPMEFLVMRGQGIKLTSYIAKKCREKGVLLPAIEKQNTNEGYEGAIVLPPKTDLYLDKPVACVDYSSLYPSSMISENISHDSKVWTREYDLKGNLLKQAGETNDDGSFKYDNLPGYKYIDIEYDTYEYRRKTPKAAETKQLRGKKICRYAQFPKGEKGCMPAILEELLKARKNTRKQIPHQTNDFMKKVLDKRQLSIKITANSLYGQTGAKTSSFYEVDVAAATTAIGRKLLRYAQKTIETAYGNKICSTKYGDVISNAEYIYGDTDSVFFTFNLKELNGEPIVGHKALDITIDLAKEAGEEATKCLKNPHDLEYEKTFMPFCLLSKKRYVGMLYENDPDKAYRKSMGIVLKRRDNAPIVKDIYGGIIDILMKEKNIIKAIEFLRKSLQELVDEKVPIEKLIITKSLRSHYKVPMQIAHKVLADRMGKRDPGNKPSSGDRIPFVYIQTKGKVRLQGDRIETPAYIKEKKLKIDYSFYISNQIMKPVQQVFALVLDKIPEFKSKKALFNRKLEKFKNSLTPEKYEKKQLDLKNKMVKELLFEDYLRITNNKKNKNKVLTMIYC